MNAPGYVSGTGENIYSRESSVQISNIGATLNYYTETICSANRDKTQYPNPAQYVIPLSKVYKRVLEVELLSSNFPRSQYTIECFENGIKGNNCFRFGEGYIIDDGKFGISNNRLSIKEYNDASLIQPNPCLPPLCPPTCSIHDVLFPQTLSLIDKIEKISDCLIRVKTSCPHEFTTKYNSKLCIVDAVLRNVENVNGSYELHEIINEKTFIAKALICGGPNLCHKNESHDSYETNECNNNGWVLIERISGPHELACMIQDYLNERACPKVCNAYSVCFNDKTGRFVFTRAYGLKWFDLLASYENSIMQTLGYPAVDYLYGSWAHQNIQQTRLPSDMLCDQIRPDIVSQTCGESAGVCIERGNYNETTLSHEITNEMNRPIIIKCKNDVLVVQILGQVVEMILPQGMYSPDLLIESIVKQMNIIYCIICKKCSTKDEDDTEKSSTWQKEEDDEEIKCKSIFDGCYNLKTGAYNIHTTDGSMFGLLFSQSTVGFTLGFDRVDMLGNCCYQSMKSVYYPVMNRRFTDQMYKVVAQPVDATFRFIKVGTYQAPVVKIISLAEYHKDEIHLKFARCCNTQSNESNSVSSCSSSFSCSSSCETSDNHSKDCKLVIFTWTKKCGGAAHGFAPGDIAIFDGPDKNNIEIEPKLIGKHIVEKVFDAFSFQISGKILNPNLPNSESCSLRSSRVLTCCNYVVSHQTQPFFLFFPGVCNTISTVVGFPCCVSNRYDYQGPNQWDFESCSSLFLNINEFADTDYGRISKSSDSGNQSKYSYQTLNSFVRVPNLFTNDFGLLSSSSFARRKRFLFNTETLANLSVKIVDFAGELINFHGKDHIIEIRILTEQ